MATKIAAVIVTYNNITMLEPLLVELVAQSRALDEIIVVDNASIDRTEDVMRARFPAVKYLRLSSNQGSAGGYREGIKTAVAGNDLIWLLDDDVSVSKDTLLKLVQGMERLVASGENVGAVRSLSGRSNLIEKPVEAKGFAWRGTLMTSVAVKDTGLPRSEYFLYAEDMEYSTRMVKKGYKVFYIPDSWVVEKRPDDRIKIEKFGIKAEVYKEPYRFYYASRNQVNVFLEYRDYVGLYKTLGYLAKVMLLFVVLRYEKRRESFRAIACGLRDGFAGKLGKNSRYGSHL
jgi:GT2 family glycosyltransferase